jgi:serine/threonine-protein kinase
MLGRYALYEKIAAGGMASVHIGRLVGPVGFARTVAIKRMRPQFAEDPEFVSMFLDEARLAARIRHPNVVPTLDVVSEGGELFLVMELVQGESLSRLMIATSARGERISPSMAATIMAGVLHGLHAAHEATSETGSPLDVVHRDVSPHNILVGLDGVARVLDFGVAKAAGRSHTTRDGQLKGKLAYMAPEQLRGKVSRVTDVYAASVVLWEALTGKRLFEGDNDAHVFGRVLEGCRDLPSLHAPDVPIPLDAITMRGLSLDPEKRFPTARAMACALEDALPATPASRISAWVEEVARETLSRRMARIASIESDAGLRPEEVSVEAPAALPAFGENGDGARSELLLRPQVPPDDRLDAPGGTAALPTHLLAPVVSDDSMPTQLSSSARASASPPPPRTATKWLLGAGAVLLLGAGIGIGSRGSSVGATPPVAPAAAAPEPLPVTAPAVPAPSAPAIPTMTASTAPPPRAAPATPKPAQAPATNCDPPYTVNAAGHRVRKPACF